MIDDPMMARVAMWAAIFGAVTMALLPHPPHVPIDRFGDKFEHMLAFGVIAALAAWGHSRVPLVRIGERLSFLGALVELFQSIPALHRDCDVRDWIADTVSIAMVLAVFALARRRRISAAT